MKLTIGFSTLAERVSNIRFPGTNYEYLVLVQNPNQVSYPAPAEATLVEVLGKGVAKSRNQAIYRTQTELLIFGDDDVVFHPAELDKAIEKFEQNPDLTMLLLAAKDETGKARKQYPSGENKLTLLNSARAATYEMMIRVQRVKELEVKFDERFGAGAELYLGDEYIFISDLIKAGARCEFAPIYVATHPSDSSGERWGTAIDRKARAAVFDRVFGPSAPVIRFAFGLRRLKLLGGFRQLLLFVLGR
jgi:hypothetical protein